MPSGKKRKRAKISTHKRKKIARANRHKKKKQAFAYFFVYSLAKKNQSKKKFIDIRRFTGCVKQ